MSRDLVRIIGQTKDFRSYVISLAIEVLFNLIEVGGPVAIARFAQNEDAVSSLKA